MDNRLIKSFENYNTDVLDWKYEIYNSFSKENSNSLIKKFIADSKNRKFKNVIIILIYSISNFQSIIMQEEKDILLHFNNLNPEQQPFFLFIDYDENNDFFVYQNILKVKKEKQKDKNPKNISYAFQDIVIKKILEYQRKEMDFELKIDVEILKDEKEKLETIKDFLLKKYKNKED